MTLDEASVDDGAFLKNSFDEYLSHCFGLDGGLGKQVAAPSG